MASGGHIECCKMLIFHTGQKYWRKIWYKDATRRCPRDQKQKQKLIRMKSSLMNIGNKCGLIVLSDYTRLGTAHHVRVPTRIKTRSVVVKISYSQRTDGQTSIQVTTLHICFHLPVWPGVAQTNINIF